MLKSFISVLFSLFKFTFLKCIYGHRFTWHGIQRFSPNTEICIDSGGQLILGNLVRAHSGTRIRVRKNAKVIIGNDIAFGYNCLITAHDTIEICDGCEIGPGVLFYDHDHDTQGHSIKEKLFKTSPIKIGKNVWIGANVIILRGTFIGDNCVIGAGSIIKGNIPAGTKVIQKRAC